MAAASASRLSRPAKLPPVVLLAGVYGLLVALHAPLLRLPYYWDEAGYFIFAALDFFHHGWLAPHSTLANGHPPLLSLYLSLAWAIGGFYPVVTRVAMLLWAALLAVGVHRLAVPRLGPRGAAVPALWIALCPLGFAQATLAQLDLPVAALIVWGLVERHRLVRCALLLSAACLMKETAVLAPLVLLATERRRGRQSFWLALPFAALAAWFAGYHHLTGYWMGNPQYFAYNVGQAAVSPPRILLSLARRVWQLAGYNGAWLLTLLAGIALWRGRRGARPLAAWPAAWSGIVVLYLFFHAVIGGAVLARYLLPALALYFVLLAELILRLPKAPLWVAVCTAFLIAGWFWNPPYPFPFEDNLAYVQFIRLHQAAAHELERSSPTTVITTAWPATDELTRPELGYVAHPLAVRPIEDFSAASLAAQTQAPDVLYLYSREYEPRHDLLAWAPFWRRWGGRFFHYSPPAPAAAWLARWHLVPDFGMAGRGQWVWIARPASSASPPAASPSSSRPAVLTDSPPGWRISPDPPRRRSTASPPS